MTTGRTMYFCPVRYFGITFYGILSVDSAASAAAHAYTGQLGLALLGILCLVWSSGNLAIYLKDPK